MGRGGFRDPNTGKFLGKGDEGLRRYKEALERLEKQTRGTGGKPPVISRVGTAVSRIGTLGIAADASADIGPGGRAQQRILEILGIGDGDTTTGPDRLIRQRDNNARGNCPNMNDLASDGSRCGRRAASVRGPTRGYDPPRRRKKTGPCPHMNDIASDGSRCGRRAASVRGPTRGYDGI